MSLITDLALFLRSRAAIRAVVGERVYWKTAPRNTPFPYITYQRISGARMHPLSGTSRMARPVYQIEGWHDDPDGCEALATAILGLDQFDGYIGSTIVRNVELLSDREIDEPPLAAADVGVTRLSYDFRIDHEETLPGI